MSGHPHVYSCCKKLEALKAEILTVREVSGNRLQLWSDVCKERDRMFNDVQKTMDMYEDILSRNVMLVKEKDRLKARVERYEKALKDIVNLGHAPECEHKEYAPLEECPCYTTSPWDIAKQALAEQEGK